MFLLQKELIFLRLVLAVQEPAFLCFFRNPEKNLNIEKFFLLQKNSIHFRHYKVANARNVERRMIFLKLLNRYKRGLLTCPQAKTSKSGKIFASTFGRFHHFRLNLNSLTAIVSSRFEPTVTFYSYHSL